MPAIVWRVAGLKIARVFPRRTTATPDDALAFDGPPGLYPPEVDEVHVSVAFDEDLLLAERLAAAWQHVAPVKIGGPALGDPGGDFVPGRYIKKGYVITSRGCPNRCWFCSVWRRDGDVRELPITEGHIVQDDNLLACSDVHRRAVFAMLARQKKPVELRGLEAARLTPAIVAELWHLRPLQMFFAYDEAADLEPLLEAGELLHYADFTRRHLRCYVLVGYKNDTVEAAEARLYKAWTAGFMPCAMLYEHGRLADPGEWSRLHKTWMRPAFIKRAVKSSFIKNQNFSLLEA